MIIQPYKKTYLQEEQASVPDPDCPFVWSRKCGDVTDSVDQTILCPFPDWPDCSSPPPSPPPMAKTQEIRPSDADAVTSSRLRRELS